MNTPKMLALGGENLKDIEAEKAAFIKVEIQRVQEQYALFRSHIPLFWANREMIIGNAIYGNIALFKRDNDETVMAIGQYLQIWSSPHSVFTGVCSECGGKTVKHEHINFLNISFNWHRHTDHTDTCVNCGEYDTSVKKRKNVYRPSFDFEKRIKALVLDKYPVESDACSAVTLEELIEECKKIVVSD